MDLFPAWSILADRRKAFLWSGIVFSLARGSYELAGGGGVFAPWPGPRLKPPLSQAQDSGRPQIMIKTWTSVGPANETLSPRAWPSRSVTRIIISDRHGDPAQVTRDSGSPCVRTRTVLGSGSKSAASGWLWLLVKAGIGLSLESGHWLGTSHLAGGHSDSHQAICLCTMANGTHRYGGDFLRLRYLVDFHHILFFLRYIQTNPDIP